MQSCKARSAVAKPASALPFHSEHHLPEYPASTNHLIPATKHLGRSTNSLTQAAWRAARCYYFVYISKLLQLYWAMRMAAAAWICASCHC